MRIFQVPRGGYRPLRRMAFFSLLRNTQPGAVVKSATAAAPIMAPTVAEQPPSPTRRLLFFSTL